VFHHPTRYRTSLVSRDFSDFFPEDTRVSVGRSRAVAVVFSLLCHTTHNRGPVSFTYDDRIRIMICCDPNTHPTTCRHRQMAMGVAATEGSSRGGTLPGSRITNRKIATFQQPEVHASPSSPSSPGAASANYIIRLPHLILFFVCCFRKPVLRSVLVGLGILASSASSSRSRHVKQRLLH